LFVPLLDVTDKRVDRDVHTCGVLEFEVAYCEALCDKDTWSDYLGAGVATLFISNAIGNVRDIDGCFAGNRDLNRGHGIELDRNPPTLYARDRRLKQPSHQIHEDRPVPGQVILPVLRRDQLIRSTLFLTNLGVRLFEHSVHILMQKVDQVVDKFS